MSEKVTVDLGDIISQLSQVDQGTTQLTQNIQMFGTQVTSQLDTISQGVATILGEQTQAVRGAMQQMSTVLSDANGSVQTAASISTVAVRNVGTQMAQAYRDIYDLTQAFLSPDQSVRQRYSRRVAEQYGVNTVAEDYNFNAIPPTARKKLNSTIQNKLSAFGTAGAYIQRIALDSQSLKAFGKYQNEISKVANALQQAMGAIGVSTGIHSTSSSIARLLQQRYGSFVVNSLRNVSPDVALNSDISPLVTIAAAQAGKVNGTGIAYDIGTTSGLNPFYRFTRKRLEYLKQRQQIPMDPFDFFSPQLAQRVKGRVVRKNPTSVSYANSYVDFTQQQYETLSEIVASQQGRLLRDALQKAGAYAIYKNGNGKLSPKITRGQIGQALAALSDRYEDVISGPAYDRMGYQQAYGLGGKDLRRMVTRADSTNGRNIVYGMQTLHTLAPDVQIPYSSQSLGYNTVAPNVKIRGGRQLPIRQNVVTQMYAIPQYSFNAAKEMQQNKVGARLTNGKSSASAQQQLYDSNVLTNAIGLSGDRTYGVSDDYIKEYGQPIIRIKNPQQTGASKGQFTYNKQDQEYFKKLFGTTNEYGVPYQNFYDGQGVQRKYYMVGTHESGSTWINEQAYKRLQSRFAAQWGLGFDGKAVDGASVRSFADLGFTVGDLQQLFSQQNGASYIGKHQDYKNKPMSSATPVFKMQGLSQPKKFNAGYWPGLPQQANNVQYNDQLGNIALIDIQAAQQKFLGSAYRQAFLWDGQSLILPQYGKNGSTGKSVIPGGGIIMRQGFSGFKGGLATADWYSALNNVGQVDQNGVPHLYLPTFGGKTIDVLKRDENGLPFYRTLMPTNMFKGVKGYQKFLSGQTPQTSGLDADTIMAMFSRNIAADPLMATLAADQFEIDNMFINGQTAKNLSLGSDIYRKSRQAFEKLITDRAQLARIISKKSPRYQQMLQQNQYAYQEDDSFSKDVDDFAAQLITRVASGQLYVGRGSGLQGIGSSNDQTYFGNPLDFIVALAASSKNESIKRKSDEDIANEYRKMHPQKSDLSTEQIMKLDLSSDFTPSDFIDWNSSSDGASQFLRPLIMPKGVAFSRDMKQGQVNIQRNPNVLGDGGKTFIVNGRSKKRGIFDPKLFAKFFGFSSGILASRDLGYGAGTADYDGDRLKWLSDALGNMANISMQDYLQYLNQASGDDAIQGQLLFDIKKNPQFFQQIMDASGNPTGKYKIKNDSATLFELYKNSKNAQMVMGSASNAATAATRFRDAHLGFLANGQIGAHIQMREMAAAIRDASRTYDAASANMKKKARVIKVPKSLTDLLYKPGMGMDISAGLKGYASAAQIKAPELTDDIDPQQFAQQYKKYQDSVMEASHRRLISEYTLPNVYGSQQTFQQISLLRNAYLSNPQYALSEIEKIKTASAAVARKKFGTQTYEKNKYEIQYFDNLAAIIGLTGATLTDDDKLLAKNNLYQLQSNNPNDDSQIGKYIRTISKIWGDGGAINMPGSKMTQQQYNNAGKMWKVKDIITPKLEALKIKSRFKRQRKASQLAAEAYKTWQVKDYKSDLQLSASQVIDAQDSVVDQFQRDKPDSAIGQNNVQKKRDENVKQDNLKKEQQKRSGKKFKRNRQKHKYSYDPKLDNDIPQRAIDFIDSQFTQQEKMRAVELAQNVGQRQASRQMHGEASYSTINRWMKYYESSSEPQQSKQPKEKLKEIKYNQKFRQRVKSSKGKIQKLLSDGVSPQQISNTLNIPSEVVSFFDKKDSVDSDNRQAINQTPAQQVAKQPPVQQVAKPQTQNISTPITSQQNMFSDLFAAQQVSRMRGKVFSDIFKATSSLNSGNYVAAYNAIMPHKNDDGTTSDRFRQRLSDINENFPQYGRGENSQYKADIAEIDQLQKKVQNEIIENVLSANAQQAAYKLISGQTPSITKKNSKNKHWGYWKSIHQANAQAAANAKQMLSNNFQDKILDEGKNEKVNQVISELNKQYYDSIKSSAGFSLYDLQEAQSKYFGINPPSKNPFEQHDSQLNSVNARISDLQKKRQELVGRRDKTSDQQHKKTIDEQINQIDSTLNGEYGLYRYRDDMQRIMDRGDRYASLQNSLNIQSWIKANHGKSEFGKRSRELDKEKFEAQKQAILRRIELQQGPFGDIPDQLKDLRKRVQDTPYRPYSLSDNARHVLRRIGSNVFQGVQSVTNNMMGVDLGISVPNVMHMTNPAMAVAEVLGSIATTVTNFVNTMVQNVKVLDKTATQIQMITGQSRQESRRHVTDAYALASQLGVSASDTANASVALYRQGLSTSQVHDRLQTAVKFGVVSGGGTQSAIKTITVALNSGLVQNAQQATDVLATLGDTAATTAEQIAMAMQRSAASSAQLGVSFNELAAMIAVVEQSTQLSGASVGTFFKTTLSRMNKLSSSGYVYDAQSGVTTSSNQFKNTMKSINRQLSANGMEQIKYLDQNGKILDSGTILRNLGSGWGNLNDQQRAAVTYAMSGTRSVDMMYALMQGIQTGRFDQLLQNANNSQGSVDKKYNAYQQSVQASQNRLANAKAMLGTDTVAGAWFTNAINDVQTFGLNILSTIGNVMAGSQAQVLNSANSSKAYRQQKMSSANSQIEKHTNNQTAAKQLNMLLQNYDKLTDNQKEYVSSQLSSLLGEDYADDISKLGSASESAANALVRLQNAANQRAEQQNNQANTAKMQAMRSAIQSLQTWYITSVNGKTVDENLHIVQGEQNRGELNKKIQDQLLPDFLEIFGIKKSQVNLVDAVHEYLFENIDNLFSGNFKAASVSQVNRKYFQAAVGAQQKGLNLNEDGSLSLNGQRIAGDIIFTQQDVNSISEKIGSNSKILQQMSDASFWDGVSNGQQAITRIQQRMNQLTFTVSQLASQYKQLQQTSADVQALGMSQYFNQLAKGGNSAIRATAKMQNEMRKLSHAQGLLDNAKKNGNKFGDDDAKWLAQYLGLPDAEHLSTSQVQAMLGNSAQAIADSATVLINDVYKLMENNPKFAEFNLGDVLQMKIDGDDSGFIQGIQQIAQAMIADGQQAVQQMGQALLQFFVSNNPWVQLQFQTAAEQSGDQVSISANVTGTNQGFSKGGGGGGKSKAKKLQQKFARQDRLYKHQIAMVQKQQDLAQQQMKLTDYGIYLQRQIELQKAHIPVLQQQIMQAEKQLKTMKAGTQAYDQMQELVYSLHEQLKDLTNTIQKNTQALRQNRSQIRKTTMQLEDTISGVYEQLEQRRISMLQGEVNIQQQIIDTITERYQREQQLIDQNIQAQRNALEQEKNLLSERLNARKAESEQQQKYNKLQQMRRQYSLLSMDPTRQNEAKKLAKQIADLQKQIAWDVASNEVDAQTNALQSEQDALDAYQKKVDDFYDNIFEHPQVIIEEAQAVMQQTMDQILLWLEQANEQFANSSTAMRQQMIDDWTQTIKQWKNITDTYWTQVNIKMAGSLQQFLELMMQTSDYMNASDTNKQQMIYQWTKLWNNYHKSITDTAEPAHTQNSNYGAGTGGGGSGGAGPDVNTVNKNYTFPGYVSDKTAVAFDYTPTPQPAPQPVSQPANQIKEFTYLGQSYRSLTKPNGNVIYTYSGKNYKTQAQVKNAILINNGRLTGSSPDLPTAPTQQTNELQLPSVESFTYKGRVYTKSVKNGVARYIYNGVQFETQVECRAAIQRDVLNGTPLPTNQGFEKIPAGTFSSNYFDDAIQIINQALNTGKKDIMINGAPINLDEYYAWINSVKRQKFIADNYSALADDLVPSDILVNNGVDKEIAIKNLIANGTVSIPATSTSRDFEIIQQDWSGAPKNSTTANQILSGVRTTGSWLGKVYTHYISDGQQYYQYGGKRFKTESAVVTYITDQSNRHAASVITEYKSTTQPKGQFQIMMQQAQKWAAQLLGNGISSTQFVNSLTMFGGTNAVGRLEQMVASLLYKDQQKVDSQDTAVANEDATRQLQQAIMDGSATTLDGLEQLDIDLSDVIVDGNNTALDIYQQLIADGKNSEQAYNEIVDVLRNSYHQQFQNPKIQAIINGANVANQQSQLALLAQLNATQQDFAQYAAAIQKLLNAKPSNNSQNKNSTVDTIKNIVTDIKDKVENTSSVASFLESAASKQTQQISATGSLNTKQLFADIEARATAKNMADSGYTSQTYHDLVTMFGGESAITEKDKKVIQYLNGYDVGGYIDRNQIAIIHGGEYILTQQQVRDINNTMSKPMTFNAGNFAHALQDKLAGNGGYNIGSINVSVDHLDSDTDFEQLAARVADSINTAMTRDLSASGLRLGF